jgi:hypothetical protein
MEVCGAMQVSDLKPNPKNPRKSTDKKRARLKKTMVEYGDLSGVVFNSQTGNLVGGHQRKTIFDGNTKIVIEKKYPKPTPTGTVARGYLLFNKERFSYREVCWPLKRELAANLAANKNAGDWDTPKVKDVLKELASDDGFDVELTGFDDKELARFTMDEGDDLDDEEKAPQRKFVMIKCPHCQKTFEESRGGKTVEKR